MTSLRILVLLLGLFAIGSSSTSAVSEHAVAKHNERPWRLPTTTYPIRYTLHLTTQVDREIFEFHSNCTIEIQVQQNTQELVLHAKDLRIVSVALKDLTTNTEFPDVRHTLYDPKELLIITSGNSATFERDHRLRLEIVYDGVINQDDAGLHSITYEDANKKTVFGAITQFDPLGKMQARTALPCYDEPSFKSNFTISLTHGGNLTAISNMPAIGHSHDSAQNMITTNFMETPPISPNSLGFAIFNYGNISDAYEGVKHRFFTPPTQAKKETHKKLMRGLKVFGDYMEVPYPLPKLDYIETPETFGALPLESWGLVSYGSENTKLTHKVGRLRMLTLQWFGNLISPKWWDSQWLTNDFASYYAYVLMDMLSDNDDELKKAANYLDFNICLEVTTKSDAAHLSQYVETTSELRVQSSLMAFGKGVCLIQMFDHALGQAVFRKGVSNYLKHHAYSVVNEYDLYDALQIAALDLTSNQTPTWKYNVQDIMKSWTNNQGFPFVTVTRNYNNNYNTITIRQRATKGNNSTGLWWIPLNFVTASQPNFESTKADLYMPPVAELTIDLSTLNIDLHKDDWLIVNKRGKGVYDVTYDAQNLRLIGEALLKDHKTIHKLNRVQILKDILQSWRNKEHVELKTALNIAKYLHNEADPLVWSYARRFLHSLKVYLQETSLEQLYYSFAGKIIEPAYTQQMIHYGKSLHMSSLACELENTECLLQRKVEVLAQMSNNDTFDDLTDICFAAKVFNDAEFERALDFAKQRQSEHNWSGLMCTKNEQQYEKFLQAIFDISADGQNNDEKLFVLAYLPFLSTTRHTNTTSTLWDKYKSRILNATPSNIESFCYAILGNMKTLLPDRTNSKIVEVVELCQHHNLELEFSFKTMKKDANYVEFLEDIKWFHDNLINEDSRRYLEKENEIQK